MTEGQDDFPDFVSFSKKAQASGFFHKRETRPSEGYRNYNTWMGHPMSTLIATTIINQIKEHKLLEHTALIGDALYGELETVFAPYGKVVENLRGKGRGTFIAFDFVEVAKRDAFVKGMRAKGVLIGACGERTVRLRPMLVFGQEEKKVLVEAMKGVLGEL